MMFELDAVFLFISVVLSITFSKGIIKGLTERVSSVVETLSVLNFSAKLKLSIIDPANNALSDTFEDLYRELYKNQQIIEKSVRCNISACTWIVLAFLMMILLKEGKIISETYSELFKLLLFFTAFLYAGYYSWAIIDRRLKKFAHNKKNVNTSSRHNLLIFLSMLSIPFIVGNYEKWSHIELASSILAAYIATWLATRTYRAICVNRFEETKGTTIDETRLARQFYLSGTNIESLVYFTVAIILFFTVNLIPIDIKDIKHFAVTSLSLACTPIAILLIRLFIAAPSKSLTNYFFGARPAIHFKWNSTKD